MKEDNYTTLKYKIILSFLGPLLLTFLYVHDLVYAMIQPYVSEELWWVIRVLPVLVYAGLRASLIRDEVQF